MVRASKQNPLPNAPLELSDPIALPAGEPPGAELLRELSPEHAALLFDVLRVATAWAADGGASGWYDARMLRGWEEAVLTADLDEPLRSAVAVLLGELVDPASADPGRLSLCCLQISEWSLEIGAESTSLTFARVGALIQPANPSLAYLTGRRYRSAGQFHEAHRWLRRSARIALWQGDWEIYAHALTSLGMLAYRQDDYPRARSFLSRALRVAERHGLWTLAGEIYHDRFTVAFISGEDHAVEKFARAALDRYLPFHERLPALGYDLAYYWLTRGYAARALRVFRALLPCFPESGEQFQLMCASARAAGALGERDACREMYHRAMELLSDIGNRAVASPALLDLGYGAAQVQDWTAAEIAFIQARTFAESHQQAEDERFAGEAIAAVHRRENPDPLRLRFVLGEENDLRSGDGE